MSAISGIWNHAMGVVNPLARANATAGSPGSGGDSSNEASTISANDFLTLLVTEMKNQDPTADTDPNEYINQLVQVNSLEQLIDINQNLTSALGTPASGGSQPAPHAGDSGPAPPSQIVNASHAATMVEPAGTPPASGNLSIPAAMPAAQRVAEALNGRH